MSIPKFSSIEEYLAALEPAKAATIRAIVDFILAEFPELEVKISWNVPNIHRNGKYVVGLAAYKHHLTFAPWSIWVMEDFKDRLNSFAVFKNCFRIPVDWKVDKDLVRDLVRARLAELEPGMSTSPQSLPQYIPVSCEFHDRLEDLATLRKQASVSYFDDGGVQQQRDAVINDVFAREGADYVALSSGETVRMDRLIEVDGYQLADFPPDCAI
jgi:uncharacterized protein YdhG (YjbR/CyaY superfamily)/transcriptional antiterminator Rof (Rho-off)